MNREEALKEFEGHPNIREAAEKSGLTQRDWLERHLDEKYKGNAEEFRRDLDRALWGEADGYGEFGLPQYDSLSSFEPPNHAKLKGRLTGSMAAELGRVRDLELALKSKYPEGKGNLAHDYGKYLKQVSEGKPSVLNHLKQRSELAGPVIKMLCEAAKVKGGQAEPLAGLLSEFASRRDAPFKVTHWRGFAEKREPFPKKEVEALTAAMGGKEKAAEALKKVKGSISEFSKTIDENARGKGTSVEEVHNVQHLTQILGKAIEHLRGEVEARTVN